MSYWRKIREGNHRRRKVLLRPYSNEKSRGATYSQCSKKGAYASLRYAERLAAEILKSRGQQLKVYECPACLMYHLAKVKHNF